MQETGRPRYLLMIGLFMLVAGLPLSLFLTSLSQFFLAGSFFLEGKVNENTKRFFSNKYALLFAGIWLMHVIGLAWTSDFAEGWKDVRIKLPLLIMPVVLAGAKPLTEKQFHSVLLAFTGAVFAGTIVSMAVLGGIIIHRPVLDIRDIFIFNISHIRFALFTCLAVFILIYFLLIKKNITSPFLKIFTVVLLLWFCLFLVIIESVTGIMILFSLALLFFIYYALRSGSLVRKISLVLLLLCIPLVAYFSLKKLVDDFYLRHPPATDFSAKTKTGNPYLFNPEDNSYENGYRVWDYVNFDEMREEWNKKSAINFDSLDERKQKLKFTLLRFLTSKGWKKDGEAVAKLSEKEIHSVEHGIASVNDQNVSSIRSRLLQIVWEFDQYRKGENPSGHSVTQRFEFWRAAEGIIKDSFWTGVGTGDLKHAYDLQYEQMHSQLDQQHRLHAHNQFLSILAALGIFGLIYFLFAFMSPLLSSSANFLFIVFLFIALSSMLTEDTLETQPGATFVGFFFCLLLFEKSGKLISETRI